MAAEYPTILSATIGTSEFQVTNYTVSDQPLLKDGWPVGHTIEVGVEGYIQGTSADDLATKLAAFMAAAPSPGADLVIKGMGGKTLYRLMASQCMNAGPHVKLNQQPLRLAELRAEFKVSLSGETPLSELEKDKTGGGGSMPQGTSVAYVVRTDGWSDVTINGEASGATAESQVGQAVAAAREAYPWPDYKVSYTQKRNLPADKWEFTISATYQAIPLEKGTTTRAVDGTFSKSIDVDAEAVKTTTWSYDLVCDDDPLDLEAALRPATALISASVEVGGYEKQTLRARYTTVESDLGDGLLEFKQRLEIAGGEDALVRPVTFDGVGTILVYQSTKRPFTVKQTGSAVSTAGFPIEAAPLSITGYFPDRDKVITSEQVDASRYRTTWDYSFVGLSPIVGNAAKTLILAIIVRARGM